MYVDVFYCLGSSLNLTEHKNLLKCDLEKRLAQIFGILFVFQGYIWETFHLGSGQNQHCHLQAA